METWRDIVAEMRGMREFLGSEYRAMADRIEAACKTLEDVLIVEQDENAKLRRALEPVMKCEISEIEIVKSSETLELSNETLEKMTKCVNAISKAQAIMKEGAE